MNRAQIEYGHCSSIVISKVAVILNDRVSYPHLYCFNYQTVYTDTFENVSYYYRRLSYYQRKTSYRNVEESVKKVNESKRATKGHELRWNK